MELTERKKAVLSAIIKSYIETGEPVGSKLLTELIENAPSSATLRNEMSELCALGFLEQPHTSAGRVPTSRGIRLYLSSIMKTSDISETAKAFIDERVKQIKSEPEKIPSEVGKILSDLTGLPTISFLTPQSVTAVRKIELLPITARSIMILLITTDGRARNRIVRTENNLADDIYEKFSDICRNKIKGRALSELNKPYMQSIIVSQGLDSLALLPLVSTLFELIEDIENSSVELSGEPHLYNICGSEDSARKIISLIKRRDPVISLMDSINEGVGVIFGSDTDYSELNSDIIIAARFGDKIYNGIIAVIGPRRTSYEEVIPSIEYAAQRLKGLMGEALKDMEG